MALSDYYLCDICGSKTFYDANINYNDDGKITGVGDIQVLCGFCATKYKVIIVPIQQPKQEGNT